MASVTVTRSSERPHRRPAHQPGRRLSPLTVRVLAVNVLALALLVGGLLYLGRYQDRLIDAEMEALQTQARIFATALGEGAVQRAEAPPADRESGEAPAEIPPEIYELSPELARQMVRRLVEATETRTRLFTPDGRLVSDSRVLTGSAGTIQIVELPPPDESGAPTRAAVALYNWLTDTIPGRDAFPLYREQPDARAAQYPDAEHALAGEESSTVWRTERPGERPGLVLTVAIPIQRYKQVLGTVMLSRGGAEIDEAIRSVRFDILRVFAIALAVTVLLSVYLAGTIARPIRRLARAADRVRTGHGRQVEIPDFTGRGDEIGDLSGTLRDMTAALWARMDAIERFAADVAHEIKNPLTSLRSAVETVSRVNDPGRRERLMAIIADDVQRLDRLISDISNASRLDAELSRARLEPVDIGAMLAMLADIHAATAEGAPDHPQLSVTIPTGADLTVPGLEGRLTQVFQNLIANAVSFSPPGGTVHVAARREGGAVVVTVADSGPGIPEGKEEAIFERFYTERPAGEKFGTHSGLGLSISKQIVEAHAGGIAAANRRDESGEVAGAVFTVRLPVTV
ncbi:stimulus-sensing domain-containing protein [Azospirillum sp. TSO22-1]|uniref:stimulus-sensing domain-containing protein n=1 Tax=Azospirillum sp. TSO22-1 TaxID=716789 RepID=UPI000D61A782|nr:stimulus-sensing domain-containing protein [Azospirillum sp. TSO22-1]PWC55030.1 histidine kinase [Azospirillum sp. TSO22-1]